jgi:hypothetical protein
MRYVLMSVEDRRPRATFVTRRDVR